MPTRARIGTEFAGYRLEALVARGGTSTVYRAEYPRLGIPVALKILNPEIADDESLRERFVRESRLAAGINHPNIIPIYDTGVWEDSLYIAMRFVPGGDLKQRVSQGPLAPERTIAILAQVASGLDAAHARGLIHRDVKPANVMVDAGSVPDAPEIAYITDFGLIKHVQSSGRPTPTGDFLGTIDYVAPEQIEGRPVDGRADVYSLGCVAFECLTGQPPFKRENEAAILWAHMQEEPPAPSAVWPEVSSDVDPVIARALAKNPDDRFPTCGELVSALRAALGLDALLGAATGREDRRRPLLRLLAAGFVGLALGAAGATAAFLVADEEGSAEAGGDSRTVTRVTTQATTIFEEEPGRLIELIPQNFRNTCEETTPSTADFTESLICRPGNGIGLARYSLAVSGPSLNAHLLRRLRRVGIDPDGERTPSGIGSCAARDLPAVEEWIPSGRAGHEAIGRTELGDSSGRVVCSRNGPTSRVEWTSPSLSVYAYAQGRNFRRVLSWWEDAAGPLQ